VHPLTGVRLSESIHRLLFSETGVSDEAADEQGQHSC
jgi:hypothetical protein